MDKRNPDGFAHAAFAVSESETADPSTTPRSGRDDKGEGGDFYEEPLDRMDRKTQQDKFV